MRLQEKFSFNTWARDRLIGLRILPPHLNGALYLDFIRNVLNNLLEDMPLLLFRYTTHCARNVTNCVI
jgi:hypothetical protein